MPRRPFFSSFQAFSLDPSLPEPLHRQLYEEVRSAILSGRLPAGTRLPASRELAVAADVSRNTVMAAFEQLTAEGYIVSRTGSGTFVARDLPDAEALERPRLEPVSSAANSRAPGARGQSLSRIGLIPFDAATGQSAFRGGLPALDQFPIDIWRRLSERRQRQASDLLFAYGDPQGFRPLREAIATQLSASRGVRCTPEQIIVVSGSQQALDLCARVLLDPGDQIWFENPGYFGARAAFEAAGVRLVPVPVDDEGLIVSEGIARAPSARLAYVTPSHQHPLGATMSVSRRLALLQWAAATGAWIIEDDNASEYRFRGRPLAALQGIDRDDRTLYVGTFSKVMFASLRLGYLVAPRDLVPPLVRLLEITIRHAPTLEQAVVADFLHEGHFARHVRRMRTLYAARQQHLLDALRRHARGLLEAVERPGGMSLVAWLPAGTDDAACARAALGAGVRCVPVSAYSIAPPSRPGLVLGFTGIDEDAIDVGVRRLVEALSPVMGSLRP